jgi:putative ABC transport system permease protein
MRGLRLAARALRRSPGFTAVAVVTLALGIGITTAMFAILDALILRPVPFHAPDRLAHIYMGNERGGRVTVAPAVLRAWRESPAFEAAESAMADTAILDVDGVPVVRAVARVTPAIFDMLGGVRPIRGRLFMPPEGRVGFDDRALIGEELWRSVYHADPAIVGRRVVVDGQSLEVVGILPSSFRFPSWHTALWMPIDFSALPPARKNERPRAYVRFSASLPREDALRIATDAARAADATTATLRPHIFPLSGMRPGADDQRAVPVLSGAVVLVFLVLCANVSSLVLARLTGRRREFAVCSALGASRARVMRQVGAETAIVGTLAVAIGVGIGAALVSVARAFLPDAFLLRTLHPLALDARALAVAAASGMFAMLAAGLVPAWIGTGGDVERSLRAATRSGTDSSGGKAITRGLLVGEIALACMLLVGAALLVRSFVNLSNADRGLDTEGVLAATITLPRNQLPDAASRTAAARTIDEQVRQIPGIREIAWSYGLPPDGGSISFGDWQSDVLGMSPVDLTVHHYSVGADFFALYGIPLLAGRTFQPSDTDADVVVGQRLATALWPNLDPLGRAFSFDNQHFRVIGLVREIHYPTLDRRRDTPEFYERFGGVGSYTTMSIRCGPCPDPAQVRQRISRAAAVTVIDVGPLDDVYVEQLERPRATAALAFAFAVIAALAAAAGLFSVLSYAVGRRRREFGIRTALGASGAQIRRLVLRDGFLVAVPGMAIGTAGAWMLARSIASLQYGVTIADPVSWLLVLALLTLTAAGASWRPAQEAARADPLVLLREE